MKYKCKCGNMATKKLRHINSKLGVQCFDCSLHHGESHHMWQQDREAIAMRIKVHDKCRAAVKYCLRKTGKIKRKSTRKYVSFSDADLINRLESFPHWETLKQTNWELDHIFPVKAFIDHHLYDLKLINSLDNLQPLTRKENLLKSDHYDKKQFANWLESKEVIV